MPRSKEGYIWTHNESREGLETEAVVGSSNRILESYDVVVIGAGFAGLVAARDLSRNPNLKVLLLEARDRIGGRTWTAKELGEDFEMGGTWVHWNQPHVYTELHRYDLHKNLKTSSGTSAAEKTYYKPADGALQELNGQEADVVFERIAQAFFAIDGMSSRTLMPYPHEPFREPVLWKKYDNLSVKDRLDQLDMPQFEKNLFDTLVSSFGSAPGRDIGFTEVLRWYALGGHSLAGTFEMAGIYKIGKGGMTSLVRAMLSDYTGDLLFNTPVKEMSQQSNGVMLKTDGGREIKAKYVVSTIPLNCLSDIIFDPPLEPLRSQAVEEGHINKGAKVHFKLRRTEPGWYSFANGYGSSPWCFSFSDHNGTGSNAGNGTYCIGFGYNDYLTNKADNKQIIESYKEHLRPGVDVEAYLTHDWMNDPYAKGVWSCWGTDSMTRYLQELQKPHGRIVMASADWADGWRGFVDGAIERGTVAARDVKALLKEGKIEAKL